ncbi:MAG: efflux RND transporter periplasmic adaptor subunit [bacterium]
MKRRNLLTLPVLGLACLLMLSACARDGNRKKPAEPPVPVSAATALTKTVPVQIRVIGNVEAQATVSVRSQAGGELTGIYFTEGQIVRNGSLLFTIDPRPFEASLHQAEAYNQKDLTAVQQASANLDQNLAQLNQAQAALSRDITQAKNAEVEESRYASLVQKGFATQEQYDQYRTKTESLRQTVIASRAAVENARAGIRASRAAVESARAAVAISGAAVESARLNLGYCTIHSPLEGRTGSLLIQKGNIIKANDTVPLVVIHQIRPIYVNFSIPEQDLAQVKKSMARGKLKVEALFDGDPGPPERGVLTFVDNEVNRDTGTILLKGTFANEENRLWPGQFVNVILTLATRPNAVVVPSEAIQKGQGGSYVFVVKHDNTAEYRLVVAGDALNDETVIEKGVIGGEIVVTEGQLRLVPGVPVEIIEPAQGKSVEKKSP